MEDKKTKAFQPGASSINGTRVGAFLELASPEPGVNATARVTLALSMVSIKQAEVNLELQTAGNSHAECATFARNAWATMLGRFQVGVKSCHLLNGMRRSLPSMKRRNLSVTIYKSPC